MGSLEDKDVKDMTLDEFITARAEQERNKKTYQQTIDQTNDILKNKYGVYGQGTDTIGNGHLGAFADSFQAGGASVIGGIADMLGATNIGNWANNVARDNTDSSKQFDTVFSTDYLLDPRGLTSDVGNQLGSMAALMPASMAIAHVAPVAGAAGLMARMAGKVGLNTAAKFITSQAGQKALELGLGGVIRSIPEAASEGGNSKRDLMDSGMSEEESSAKAKEVYYKNLAFLPVSNAIESMFLGGSLFNGARGVVSGKIGNAVSTTAAESALKSMGLAIPRLAPGVAANAFQQGMEEVFQQTFQDEAAGKPVGSIYDPSSWNEEQMDSFRKGAMGSLVIGAATDAYHYARSGQKGSTASLEKGVTGLYDTKEESAPGGIFDLMKQNTLSGNSDDNSNTPPAAPGVKAESNDFEKLVSAIGQQESHNDYTAENERTGAYGKYQILKENWEPWAKEAGVAGADMTDPEAQETVARFKLKQYYDKYGAKGAMQAWYGGEGSVGQSNDNNQGNGNEPSPNDYVSQVSEKMGDTIGTSTASDGSIISNVRALEGKIGHYASDGTNCMRTMGIALKGTPFEGQVNVDQAVATAKENNLLVSGNSDYVPQPGDIAVVNNGNHVVMVTEDGGTIQNGASHDGVYESKQSPKEMFGNVDYYIRTSVYGNGASQANVDISTSTKDKTKNADISMQGVFNQQNNTSESANAYSQAITDRLKKDVKADKEDIAEQVGNNATNMGELGTVLATNAKAKEATSTPSIETKPIKNSSPIINQVGEIINNSTLVESAKKAINGDQHARHLLGTLPSALQTALMKKASGVSNDEIVNSITNIINNAKQKNVQTQQAQQVQPTQQQAPITNNQAINEEVQPQSVPIANNPVEANNTTSIAKQQFIPAENVASPQRLAQAIPQQYTLSNGKSFMLPQNLTQPMINFSQKLAQSYVKMAVPQLKNRLLDLNQIIAKTNNDIVNAKNGNAIASNKEQLAKATIEKQVVENEISTKQGENNNDNAQIIPESNAQQTQENINENSESGLTQQTKERERKGQESKRNEQLAQYKEKFNKLSDEEKAEEVDKRGVPAYIKFKKMSEKGKAAFLKTMSKVVDYGGEEESRRKHIAKLVLNPDTSSLVAITKPKKDMYGHPHTDFMIAHEKGTDRYFNDVPFEYVTKAELDYFNALKGIVKQLYGDQVLQPVQNKQTNAAAQWDKVVNTKAVNNLSSSEANQVLSILDGKKQDKAVPFDKARADKIANIGFGVIQKAYAKGDITLSDAQNRVKGLVDAIEDTVKNTPVSYLDTTEGSLFKQLRETTQETTTKSEAKAQFSDLDSAKKAFEDIAGIKKAEKAPTTELLSSIDSSDEARAKAKKRLMAALSNVSSNPMFNPELHKAALDYGLILLKDGVNSFANFSKRMIADIGEKIKPWVASIWKSLESYPKDRPFDPDLMSKAVDFTGALYNQGYKSTELINDYMEKEYGKDVANKFKPLVESAFAGVDEIYNPTLKTEDTKEVNTPADVKESAITEASVPSEKLKGEKLSPANFKELRRLAKDNGGYWNRYAKQFLFDNNNGRDTFANKASELLGVENTAKEVVQSNKEEAPVADKGVNKNDLVESERLQGVPEDKATEGLQRNDSKQDSGSVRATTSRESAELLSGHSEQSNGEVSGDKQLRESSPEQDRSGSTSERADERNVVQPELAPAEEKNAKASEKPGHNFVIKDDSGIGEGSLKEKYKNNIEAIKLLKKLEAKGKMATPSEQKILAKYVGWGGLSPVFNLYERDSSGSNWDAERKELKSLLTEDEYNFARNSVLTAFYTPVNILHNIYKILDRLGFKGGRILDPAMGVGNYFGTMPSKLMKNSILSGVEIDPLSGNIAKQLYQNADVEVTGYENKAIPDNFYDLIFTNVPFSEEIKPYDPAYNKLHLPIHNYYFAKSIDKVRPGGLVAFITATSTMQSDSSAVIRNILANKADFVGALRLPDTTFKSNANTTVTYDLIILRKREENAEPAKFNQAWLNTAESGITDNGWRKADLPINEYYKNNPQMLVGKLEAGGQWGDELVVSGKGIDIAKEIESKIKNFPKNIYTPLTSTRNNNSEVATKRFLADAGTRDGAIVLKDGKAYTNESGELVAMPDKMQDKAADYVPLQRAVTGLLQAQIDPKISDVALAKLRTDLNKIYDNFVKKNGYINSDKNRALQADPNFGIVLSIENYKYDKATKEETASKKEIFTKRTVNAISNIKNADNPTDALATSLSQKGVVDVDYMAELLHKDKDEVVKNLKGLIFQDPISKEYVTSDEYLSGNVREKLEAAEEAAKSNKAYQENVDRLKAVQPVDLVPEEISVNLGTPWVPASDIQEFARNLLDTGNQNLKVMFSNATGSWIVRWDDKLYNTSSIKSGTKANNTWGLNRRNYGIKDILEYALNQQSPVVHDTYKEDGRTISVVNQKDTAAAQEKVRAIREEFKKWIWTDKERADRLTKFYNRNYNNERLREYDGSHLTLPGFNNEITLKTHQKNAVWRILQGGNTLLAHCVGAGKTWVMQTAAMEMKRLGIANKSMFVIPNHMLEQFEREFRVIYPNAKLLSISTDKLPDVNISGAKNLSKKELAKLKRERQSQRQKVLAQIATEDWDGVIITHSMFKRIPMSPEAYNKFYQQQIDEMRNAIVEIKAEEGKTGNSLVKQLEKKAKSLEAKLKSNVAEEKKDIVIPFEQLGVDQIFVDEADMFKNLYFPTKMNRVAGISNSNSQRSMDMFVKTQYLTQRNNGRGVVFATGTPISNTMAEMFTMMRYLGMKDLKEKSLAFFDNWAANFATKETVVERSPDGQGYRQVEKFSSFNNMPELIKMFRKFADVKTQDELKLDIPKLKNGKPTTIEIEQNSALHDYISGEIRDRAKAIHDKQVDPRVDNMLKLTSDLRKASLDMSLVDPTVPAEVANGKLTAVADHVYAKYKETSDKKGAQLVFCDLSTPKGASDKVSESESEVEAKDEAEDQDNITAYEQIRDMLVKQGIPSNEIAFIHDAKNQAQKAELFEKVRNGDVRVLIGSTEKMGAGTNIQTRLVALHHVDAPWRPRDIEQREGRILRQGNMNKEVEVFNYVTKDSFDANMWEKLKNKATMISQAMSNNLTTRQIEDMDATVLSFGEVEAAASGNPLMAERVGVNAEVNKYSMLYSNYLKNRSVSERKLQEMPERLQVAKVMQEQANTDISRQKDISGDKFTMTIKGVNYTKRTDAEKALEKLTNNFKNEVGEVVGRIAGLDVFMKYVKPGQVASVGGKVYTYANGGIVVNVQGSGKYFCDSKLGSIEYAATKAPQKQLAESKATTEALTKETKDLAETIKTPFEYEKKYKDLLARRDEIDKELHIGEEEQALINEEEETVNPETGEIMTSARGNEENYNRSIEELKAETKDALKGAEVTDIGNNQLSFEAPNGSTGIVDLEKGIVVSKEAQQEAKNAHGLTGEVTVQGLSMITGNNANIKLSQNSEKGTAYHEVVHVVRKLALNDKENKALDKYYLSRISDKNNKSILEEKIADSYRDWVLARQQGRGTLFGKLFQKIHDYARQLQAVLTGVENRHNVFRKIESGEAWKNSAANTGEKNSANYSAMTNPNIDLDEKINVIEAPEQFKGKDWKDVRNNYPDAIQFAKTNFNSKGGEINEKLYNKSIGKYIVITGPSISHILSNSTSSKYSADKRSNLLHYEVLAALPSVVENGVLIEEHADKHGKANNIYRLFAPVKIGNNLLTVKLTVKDEQNTFKIVDGNYTSLKVGDQQIEKSTRELLQDSSGKPVPNQAFPSALSNISIRQLLEGVNDNNGKPYINADGTGNFSIVTKDGVKNFAGNTGKDYQNNTNYSIRSTIQDKANKFLNGVPTPEKTDTAEARGRNAISYSDTSTKANVVETLKKATKDFYKNYVDDLDPLSKFDHKVEKIIGHALSYEENLHDRAITARTMAPARANMLINSKNPVEDIAAINKTMRNAKLKHNVSLLSVLKKANEISKEYLAKGAFKDGKEALSTFLIAARTLELQNQKPLNIERIQKELLDLKDNTTISGAEKTETVKKLQKELKLWKNTEYLSKISHDDAQAIVDNAPQELKDAADLYYKFNDNILTIAEDSGLISQETHDLLTKKYKNYAPMMRDFSDTEAMDKFFGGFGGKGIGNVTNSFLKKISREGSLRSVIDPLESTVKNTFTVVDRAERNKVAQIFVDLAQNNNLEGILEEVPETHSDPNRSIFTVMVDGEKVAYKTDPEYYGCIAGYSTPTATLATGIFKGAAQALRVGATTSPAFIGRNLIRDNIFAAISSQNGFVPFLDAIRGIKAIMHDKEALAEFKAAGVPMSTFVGTNRRSVAQALDALVGGDKSWHDMKPAELAINLLKASWGKAQDLSELVEMGTRMGEFIKARKNGMSVEEAGLAAKELTLNFNRAGVYSRKYNQLVPFFNAAIQGGDKMARLLFNKDKKVRQHTMLALAKYIVLPSLLLWTINHDKDWYKELPDDVKNGSWVFKVGDTIFRMPKPQESGVFFGSGIERTLDALVNKDPKYMSQWAQTTKDALLPNIIPTLVLPILEWQTNYSFFTEKNIVGRREQNLPDAQQYNLYTTELSKRIGGLTNTSPMKLDNTIKGYFGTMGGFLAGLFDPVFGKENEMPAKRWSELPGISGFTHTENKRAKSIDDFYQLYDEVHKEYMANGKIKSSVFKGLNNANKDITRLNRAANVVRNNPKLDADTKRERLDQIEAKRLKIAQIANNNYAKYVE